MGFQVTGLPSDQFFPLFSLSEDELATIGALRMKVDEDDSYPCRISLKRIAIGEDIILVNHIHQPEPSSPYRASGPIFVSRSKESGRYENELPPILRDRILSVRAYDETALIVDADVVESEACPMTINRFLANPKVAHVDVHFAKQGCFAARFNRL